MPIYCEIINALLAKAFYFFSQLEYCHNVPQYIEGIFLSSIIHTHKKILDISEPLSSFPLYTFR